MPGRDLVVVALPGGQRFIAEARSTPDVAGASDVFAALAARPATALRGRGSARPSAQSPYAGRACPKGGGPAPGL